MKKILLLLIAFITIFSFTACTNHQNSNLMTSEPQQQKVVNLFGPMEKTNPNADNIARTAFDMTVALAEQKLNLLVEYRTYTAENYKEKTYDDVTLDRIRNNMDDWYLLNPDIIQILGTEGKLVDLSVLDSAKNLREVVKTANTVDGKLVAIPQEVVVHGLFVNKDMFDKYNLALPNTPEEFLHCCEVFQQNGIETPIGANRWWLENFVFAQAYADLYNGDTTQQEIQQLNSGERKYSDYMRNGFEFLKKLIDNGYVELRTLHRELFHV